MSLTHATQSRYNQGLSKIAVSELRSMMEHNLHYTISLLTRTPAALNALLQSPDISHIAGKSDGDYTR